MTAIREKKGKTDDKRWSVQLKAFRKRYFVNKDGVDPKKRALMTRAELFAFQSTMSIEEMTQIMNEAHELRQSGNDAAADTLEKRLPVPPFMAWNMKLDYGKDELLRKGFNLADAEKYYGEGWLDW